MELWFFRYAVSEAVRYQTPARTVCNQFEQIGSYLGKFDLFHHSRGTSATC